MNAPRHLMVLVQNLMGVGHQRRAGVLCEAAVAAGWRCTLVSGSMPMAHFSPVGYEFVQLAPARCPDLAFDRLVDENGDEVDEQWRRKRSAQLAEVVESDLPDALVIETFPFGRKLLRFELIPLLEGLRARRPRPLIACSIRDIIEYRPKLKKYRVMADALCLYFDAALVHSDPRLIPLEATFPPFAQIESRVHYTGFVQADHIESTNVKSTNVERPRSDWQAAQRGATDPGRQDGEVIVSAGGGAYGAHVLETAIAARPLSQLAKRRWRILVGENLPESTLLSLQADAEPGIIVERTRPDFRELLSCAAVSISQGGYNTIMDLLVTGVPAVVVAYHDETEREQLLRAQILSTRGLVTLLPNGELSPQALADAVGVAYEREPARADIDIDGAQKSIHMLAALLSQHRVIED
jgi:predicted glycosyltransferase